MVVLTTSWLDYKCVHSSWCHIVEHVEISCLEINKSGNLKENSPIYSISNSIQKLV